MEYGPLTLTRADGSFLVFIPLAGEFPKNRVALIGNPAYKVTDALNYLRDGEDADAKYGSKQAR